MSDAPRSTAALMIFSMIQYPASLSTRLRMGFLVPAPAVARAAEAD
jgi:hypothetical protein